VTVTDDAPRNASSALARTVLDELVRGGVRHLVLCPGSRSAALAFAAYALAAEDRITLHVRIDERTAGFLALGLARTSHRPVAVVTTSGTAVVNLHPAVLEASHAGVPLVVVSADRPAALRGTGANQTTDQVKVFGSAVRAFADVPPAVPEHREAEQVRGWRSLVARTLVATEHGPVHLNLQLEGAATPDVVDGWANPCLGRPDGQPWTRRPSADGKPEPVDLTGPARTVVVAGDDAGPPARVLAESGGWPLLAEPTSGSRTGANAIRTYRLLLGDSGPDSLAGRIERVVVCGHPTLSRPITRLLSRQDVEVVALVPPRAPRQTATDPGHSVGRVVRAAVAERTGDGWLDEWLTADAGLGARLDALLDSSADLSPHAVAGAVARALPAGGLLFVGASNPVRDLDLMVPRYRVGDRRMVVANRGLSGIDGTVSSAVGAALGRPHSSRAFALMGDLTFLHDQNGLVIGADEPRPDLTVVVVNDDGGSIFLLLEQGADEHAASFERLFGTPHGVRLEAVCAATRTPYTRVTRLPELEAALDREPRGIEVVEAVVRRDDRRSTDAAIRGLVEQLGR
jgi:2-succinyl-5-enolpyruvyl-6-hydroxy-3-cyclohexene-1-carboxylate synthase